MRKRGTSSFTAAAKTLLQPGSALIQKTVTPAAKSAPWRHKEEAIATREMCWELHPGLCRTEDAELLPITTHLCKICSVVVANLKIHSPKASLVVGHYFKVLVMRRDGSPVAEYAYVLGRAVFRPVFQVLVMARDEGGVFKLLRRRPASRALLTQCNFEFFGNLARERDCDLARNAGTYEVRLQILQATLLVS